jgi:hypothetical protein
MPVANTIVVRPTRTGPSVRKTGGGGPLPR